MIKTKSMKVFFEKINCPTLSTLCPLWFNLVFLFALSLGLSSCGGLTRDIGLDNPTDLQQREGPTGTLDNPTPLDPFQRYDLVMAANECRYFTMKVPTKWYWKVFLTVANRSDTRRGKLTAAIAPVKPDWSPLPATSFNKSFDLGREGVQVVLAVGNDGPDRQALLQLCQDGAPLHITLQSEVSGTQVLIGPNDSGAVTGQSE
jgi:hypothetical protein